MLDIKNKLILGIDPGSKRQGWSIIKNGKRLASGFINYKRMKLKYPFMLPFLKEELETIIDDWDLKPGNCIVVIEEQFSGVPKELVGAIKLVILLHDLDYVEIGARENKRIFTGTGKAEKEDIIAAVHVKTHYMVKDDNEADAIALAMSLERWIYENELPKLDRKKLIREERKARNKKEEE